MHKDEWNLSVALRGPAKTRYKQEMHQQQPVNMSFFLIAEDYNVQSFLLNCFFFNLTPFPGNLFTSKAGGSSQHV